MKNIIKKLIVASFILSLSGLGNFAFAAGAPTIISATATNILQTSATLTGTINPNGDATTAWFETPDGGPFQTQNLGNGTIDVPMASYVLTGLTPNTNYTFRIITGNVNGPVTGGWVSFTTLGGITCPTPPTVSSVSPNNKNEGSPATDVTVTGTNFLSGTSQALLGGSNRTTNVTSPTTLTMSLTTSDLSTDGNFNISVTNGLGCTSETINFTVNSISGGHGGGGGGGGTISNTPIVVTQNASEIKNISATLNGTINPNSNLTNAWFEYGTSNTLSTSTETIHTEKGSGNSVLSFTQNLTNLSPNTIYYFRIIGNNNSGTSKGDIFSFKTLNPITGSVTTVQATNKYSTSTKLNGIFTNQNNSLAQGYFEYGKTNSLGSTTSIINLGTTSSIAFSKIISNLIPDTTYYFRAVAKKDGITYTGQTLTFKTAIAKLELKDLEPKIVEETNTQNPIIQISTKEENIQADGEIEYLITYNNNSSKNFENTKINIQLPDSVTFVASDLGKLGEKNTVIFDIGTLIPSQSNSVKILGKLNEKAKGQDTIVTTGIMSYNLSGSTNQEDEIAYTINKIIQTNEENNRLGAASIFGKFPFLPSTFMGWLIFILVVLAFIIIGRTLYNTYGPKNNKFKLDKENIIK